AGNAVGSLAAGYLWAGLGPAAMFDLAVLLGVLGWWVAWRGLRLDRTFTESHTQISE
ncbi:MAG: hypothetical protein JNK31_07265, partial [Candidatus Competibacter sp.]|nr:hypothetical protein [Candidatus Competibacter sp.]